MNIKEIKAFPLAYPEPHYKGIERYITLARVETEDGLVGWGECISQFREAALATKQSLNKDLLPCLSGKISWMANGSGTSWKTVSGGMVLKGLPPLP